MKRCSDCRWVKGEGEFAKCKRPVSDDPTGMENTPAICFCSGQREDGWLAVRLFGSMFVGNLCGKEGRYWEPKQ